MHQLQIFRLIPFSSRTLQPIGSKIRRQYRRLEGLCKMATFERKLNTGKNEENYPAFREKMHLRETSAEGLHKVAVSEGTYPGTGRMDRLVVVYSDP
jgi:hypothetical protein